MDNVQLANIIRKRCKAKKITLKSLLEQCGINRNFMYDLEKNAQAPSADKLEAIADYLDCSVDYLLGRTNNPAMAEPLPEDGSQTAALQPLEKPAPAPNAKQPAAKKPAAQSASAPAAAKQSAAKPAPIPAAAKQPVSKPQPDHLMPIAAHHDNPYDEEELEKLRKDIEEL